MAPRIAPRITSVGFIGSGRLSEAIARNLVKNFSPQRKFCYKKQRLVSTLLASDPLQERRRVFDQLGFTTTDQNQDVLSECDIVFIGTNARKALEDVYKRTGIEPQQRAVAWAEQLKNTLFVELMGDMPAAKVEELLYPGAKVIRMMPQTYLELSGLCKGLLPPSAWATARNEHASAEDVEQVAQLAGISTCIEINESHADLWAFDSGAVAPSNDVVDVDEDVEPEFHEQYDVGDYLGSGRFAKVYKAFHRNTGETFAVKCVKEEELTQEGSETLMAEVAALSRLHHPNVISHHGFFSEQDHYYLLLDYCDHGSVRRLLREHKRIPEVEAKSIIRQLLRALEYCHSMGLVHRDIKAENVLLTTNGENDGEGPYHVKLADFGLSKELQLVPGYLQDMCGTPQYLSPEIVSGRTYGQPADIWSAGILSYMMLSGHIPFDNAHSEAELFRYIRIGAIWYHFPEWQEVSPEAKDFVQQMLDVSPNSRPTATQLLAHKWMQE